jgi:Na+/phosphate symporter
MPIDYKLIKQELRLGYIVIKLISMSGAARDAFNRHSRSSLRQVKNLYKPAQKEISEAIKKVEFLLIKNYANDQKNLFWCYCTLSHLGIISQNILDFLNPLTIKAKENVLFSEKAVYQTNFLFDHQTGILHSLIDIFQTDNDILKQYTIEESQKLINYCLEYSAEHDDRMIDGLCTPGSAAIFLAILDRIHLIAKHTSSIVQLWSNRSGKNMDF